MYATRPLSQLLKSPASLAAPPDGPNSGYLVIQDEESKTYSWFGLCMNLNLLKLPFPQDKELSISVDATNIYHVCCPPRSVFLIPVLDQPLSSNRYYAIVPDGRHKWEALTCSNRQINSAGPRPLDPGNIHQQLEIVPCQDWSRRGRFIANSVAPDGVPPHFLDRFGWRFDIKTPEHHVKLDTAQGLDSKLRASLPGFDFPPSRNSSKAVVVGKWYSPFVFVREGTLAVQVERSMYYEVTLEQRWEKIFSCRQSTNDGRGNSVVIDASIEKEEVLVGGSKAAWHAKSAADGVTWFTSERGGVGLRKELVERMRWEQRRGGYMDGEEKRVNINKEVDVKVSCGGEIEFGCYVLVERFNLKRMDGNLVMSYDFRHFHRMKTKWEWIMFSLSL